MATTKPSTAKIISSSSGLLVRLAAVASAMAHSHHATGCRARGSLRLPRARSGPGRPADGLTAPSGPGGTADGLTAPSGPGGTADGLTAPSGPGGTGGGLTAPAGAAGAPR